MDMAIVLHDGLCWTYPTSICHVHPHDTTRPIFLIRAIVSDETFGLPCDFRRQ